LRQSRAGRVLDQSGGYLCAAVLQAGHALRCLYWWSLGCLGDWALQPRSSPWRARQGNMLWPS
jgi:hypothetical protein